MRSLSFSLSLAVFLAVALAGSCALGQEPVTQAEATAGDTTVTWQARRGLGIQYRGVDAFEPFASEFTVHDAKWTTAFYSSTRENAAAQVTEKDGTTTLDIADRSEAFSYRKKVTVAPGNRVVVEYEFGQTGLTGAHLQLGWRPAVAWLDGAAYQVTVGDKAEEGRMTYGRADRRVLWSGLREMTFRSLFGTWRMKTSHGMTLYDDRDKGSFFLGWDQPLEDGKRYQETVELTLEPAAVAFGGVKVSDFGWTKEAQVGYAGVSCALTAEAGGPREVKLRLTALRDDAEAATRETSVPLAAGPTPVRLSLPLPGPGSYSLRLVALNAANGAELFRVQGLGVKAKALMRFVPSLSLYFPGERAELILDLAPEVKPEGLTARLEGDVLEARAIPLTQRETVIPLDLAKATDGVHRVTCTLSQGEDRLAAQTVRFTKAPPKDNAVRIDYRTLGLIVDGKPYFPFGFYFHRGSHYDQEDPEYVLRLEGAFKFNLICVYHNFSPEFPVQQRPAIKNFLDKVDAVGMKMHYDVRSFTDQEPSAEVDKALADEVTAHRDAPGLLCWYLSDEPEPGTRPPARYIAHNAHMKQLDPYHPTTIVFCVPSKAHEYAEGMDILMVDPYPIPNGPVTSVADTVDLVRNATGGAMPIWCVPQAFGGGEWWGREPTWQEQRCMTYLAIVHGATGIQYFIRRPPHNNPFVDAMWAECRKMAAEIKELTPVLLSHQPAPEVTSLAEDPNLHLTARRYDGCVYLLCVNTDKQPRAIGIKCSAAPLEKTAQVLFEDRAVPVTPAGEVKDTIEGLGVRLYAYRVGEPQPGQVTLPADNLLRNGGFEQQTNVGFPDYYHANYMRETGASWGADPLVAIEGRHSLYIRCPADGEAPTVTSYPMTLKPGKYHLSAYVRADRADLAAYLGLSGFKNAPALRVKAGREWQQQTIAFEVPENTRWVHFSMRPDTRGVLWVDAAVVTPG